MDPAHKVYQDPDEQPVTKPDLKALEGGNETSEPARGHLSAVPDNDGAAAAETPAAGAEQPLDQKDLGAAESGSAGAALKQGFWIATGNPELALKERFLLLLNDPGKRRSLVGAGLVGTIISLGILFFVFVSGPGQLVQLSQVLQKGFNNSDTAASVSSNNLFRYATARDLGETRIGVLGRKFLRPALDQLKEIGIEFNLNPGAGLNSATIDTEALSKVDGFSDLANMSQSDRINFLANEFSNNGVTILPDQIQPINGSATQFSIDASSFPLASDVALGQHALSLLDNGDITTAIINREFGDYLNVSNLFHPISKLTEARLKKLGTALDNRKYAQNQEDKINQPIEEQADGAVADVDSESSTFGNPVMKSMLITGGACFMRSVSGDINTINKFRVVLPAAATATSFMALGDQVRSGQDQSVEQDGAYSDSLTTPGGQSVWQGQALQAEEGDSNPSGPDLSDDYKQAFTGSNTSSTIKSWADKAIGVALPLIPPSVACSKPGELAQIVVVLTGSALAAFGDAASGGTLTPATVGLFALHEGESFAVSAVAMHFIQGFILNKSTDAKLAKDAFSGPEGGNLLAWGSKAIGGLSAMSSGGYQLSGSAASALAYQEQQQENQQFQSESLFAKVFSVDDYRSVFGKLADTVRPTFSENVAGLAGGIGGIGEDIVSSIASIFTPRVSAAAETYNWGPQYGIAPSVLYDSRTADPYANANDVTTLLNSTCMNSDGTVNTGCSYISRASTCFGVKINLDSTGSWDVTPSGLVDTTSDAYGNADCNDTSDLNWERIIVFVLDTRTMQAMACYQGDTTSCQEDGYQIPSGGGDSGGSGGTTTNNIGYFNVVANRMYEPNGDEYIPYGISVIDDLDQPNWQNYQTQSDAQIQAASKYWHVNTIRLQVSEDIIEDNPTQGYDYNLPAMQRLGAEVSEIEKQGDIPVINDCTIFTSHNLVPSSTTLAFWKSVMEYFDSINTNNQYSNVIFDIFNEPNSNGSAWQQQMQGIVNEIRGQENNSLRDNLIMIEGPSPIASSLSIIDQYPITGTNIAYSTHYKKLNPSTWDDSLGLNLDAQVPIIEGEWSQFASAKRPQECVNDAPNRIPDFFSDLKNNHIGLIFWSLEPGVGTATSLSQEASDTITSIFPSTYQGYSTPNSFQGNYSCSSSALGQGAGADVRQYFEQNSKPVVQEGTTVQ